SHVNGVAKRHGEVSRDIWRTLWPERPSDNVPIGHVTNGVHLATWMAREVMELIDARLGKDWGERLDEPGVWDCVLSIDDGELWRAHHRMKRRLMGFIREQARRRWARNWKEAAHVVGAGTLLDPNALTIGFARRFATYKRAGLIFSALERLRELLTNQRRPVQIIFAGKAHPADNPGKEVLQSVYQFARDPEFEGRVAFVEAYDMHIPHLLVRGVDLGINPPRVPLEASGTSGMKAGLNGVPQLGTLDGWWQEGYDGLSGWAIPPAGDTEDADTADAERFYRLLEDHVIPIYHHRNAAGVPIGWVDKMRHAPRLAGSRF